MARCELQHLQPLNARLRPPLLPGQPRPHSQQWSTAAATSLHTEDPSVPQYRYRSLVSSHWLRGDLRAAYADYHQDSEEYKLAIEEYEAAKEELERLAHKEPNSPRYPRSIKSIDKDIAKSKKKLNGEPAR